MQKYSAIRSMHVRLELCPYVTAYIIYFMYLVLLEEDKRMHFMVIKDIPPAQVGSKRITTKRERKRGEKEGEAQNERMCE